MSFYSFSSEHNDDGSVAYIFSTKTYTQYRVYFYPAKDYSIYITAYKFLSEFGFICGITKVEPNELKNEPLDLLIKETVKLIFIDFINQSGENVILLYHCDYEDGKQHKRNNLFKLWHREIAKRISIYLEDTDITQLDEDGQPLHTNYLGFLILNSNPNKGDIQTEFHKVKIDLISEK